MDSPRTAVPGPLLLRVTTGVLVLSQRAAAGDLEAAARLGAVARLLDEDER